MATKVCGGRHAPSPFDPVSGGSIIIGPPLVTTERRSSSCSGGSTSRSETLSINTREKNDWQTESDRRPTNPWVLGRDATKLRRGDRRAFPISNFDHLGLTLLATNVALADDLNVATYGGAWMDAAKAAYWAPFQQQTGIKIIGDVTDDSLGAIRALAANTPAKWDVMEADMLEATEACNEGLVHPIDKSLLPAADFIPSSIQECGVASAAIGVVMVVNKGQVRRERTEDLAGFLGRQALSGQASDVALCPIGGGDRVAGRRRSTGASQHRTP